MPRLVRTSGALSLLLLLLVLDRPFGSTFLPIVSSWLLLAHPSSLAKQRHDTSCGRSSTLPRSSAPPWAFERGCLSWSGRRPQTVMMTAASMREWPTATSRSNIRFEEMKSSSHASNNKTRTKHLAQFYRTHYLRISDSKQENIQYSLWMTKPPIGGKSTSNLSSSTNEKVNEKELLATVRLCFFQDGNDANYNSSGLPEARPTNKSTTNSQNEWIWLRSLCVHTSFRQQGWARYLLKRTMMALRNHSHFPHVPPVYCFAQAALGSSLYMPLGFRHMNLEDTTMTTIGADATAMTHRPITLQQQYRAVARRLSHRGDSRTLVDLECYGYNVPDETTIHNHRISSSSLSPVNVLILQHQRETSRKTGTAQLLLEYPRHAEDDEDIDVIRGLNVTTVTWSGRIDNQNVERIFRANREKQQNRNHNNMILLWTDGTADLPSLLGAPSSAADYEAEKHGHAKVNDAERTTTASNTSSVTFVVIDATWQEAKAMFRKIPALWTLPQWSVSPTQAGRYRLRQDYGWKKKFGRRKTLGCSSPPNDNEVQTEDSLLCTAEVVAELLQQTGNIEGAAAVRRRLDSFMAKLRPIAIPNDTVE